MTPFQAYCRYIAIKNHFTKKNYDCIKYNYKVSASPTSFEKRSDKSFFYALSKHPDVDGLLISLFIRNPELWIGDIVQGLSQAESLYVEWKKRTQSLKYIFTEDIKKLDLKKDLKCLNNQHPTALLRMLRGEISVETLVILSHLTGALDRWATKLTGDVIFDQYFLVLSKYRTFLTYDIKEYRKIIRDQLLTSGSE